MNLMIVEDEIRTLNSLANNIPWEQHQIDVVALAENGTEALVIAERRMPDLMLLDIEMPGMDGLSLAEELLKRNQQIKIIILSGHDDFQFAQRAIELGVVKYLLKPAGEEEILRAVVEAAEEYKRELSEKHSLSELQRIWHSRLPQLQENLLRGWILNLYEEWELLKHAQELGLQLQQGGSYAVAVCGIDPLTATETRFSVKDIPLLQFSLERIAKEFISPQEGWVFNDSNGETVIIFYEHEQEMAEGDLTKRVNLRMSRLLSVVRECLKLTASAGMGNNGGLTEVAQSYKQAGRALQERAMYGHEIAIPYMEVKQGGQSITLEPAFERQLEMAIFTGETKQANQLIEEHFERVLTQAGSTELVYEHLLYLSGAFTRMIQSQGWLLQKVLGYDYGYFLSMEGLVSKEQIIEWAKRVVRHITAYIEHQRKSTSHQLVKQILEVVEQELAEDLTLHSLAERFYVNSSYFSRLFKKETGESFSNFVLMRRMERAKEMLLEDAKVYDAANATGYRDLSYFAKVFRKYWGVAPSNLKK